MKSRIIRKSKGEFIFDICINLIGLLVIIIVLVPLIFVVSASFSDPDLVLKGKVFLFPKGITLEPYKMVFQNKDIQVWLPQYYFLYNYRNKYQRYSDRSGSISTVAERNGRPQVFYVNNSIHYVF